MAYTDIDKSDDYFNTVLYTGNSGTQSITSLDFQPDWVWIKCRNRTEENVVFDVIRGATEKIYPNLTSAESTEANTLTSFNSDGFSLGSAGLSNSSGDTFASWNWKAGGTASSNTNGSITSSVSASTTSGFSIVSWTGDGTNATIGHGLSQAPTIYFVKNRTDSADWRVGQVLGGNIMTGGNGYYMEINDTKASTNPGSAVTWGSPPTAPTASLFTVGSNNAHNGSGDAMIAYCFHSVNGYSKMGSYTGNGSGDGVFIYTGFKPAFMISKRTNGTDDWNLHDSKRPEYNPTNKFLEPNTSDAEGERTIDFLSNGIKLYTSNAGYNASGGTYIYMCFAENPFVTSTGVPATAR